MEASNNGAANESEISSFFNDEDFHTLVAKSPMPPAPEKPRNSSFSEISSFFNDEDFHTLPLNKSPVPDSDTSSLSSYMSDPSLLLSPSPIDESTQLHLHKTDVHSKGRGIKRKANAVADSEDIRAQKRTRKSLSLKPATPRRSLRQVKQDSPSKAAPEAPRRSTRSITKAYATARTPSTRSVTRPKTTPRHSGRQSKQTRPTKSAIETPRRVTRSSSAASAAINPSPTKTTRRLRPRLRPPALQTLATAAKASPSKTPKSNQTTKPPSLSGTLKIPRAKKSKGPITPWKSHARARRSWRFAHLFSRPAKDSKSQKQQKRKTRKNKK